MIVIDCGISAVYHALPAALLPNLRSAAALDPAPSPLLRFIEGRRPKSVNGDA